MKIPTIQQLKKNEFEELLNPEYRKKLASKIIFPLFKKIFDLSFSLIALVLFSPFWIAIILLIRIDTKGKAIFKHKRVGKNGKIFTLYKFRTMHRGVNSQEYAPISLDDKRITGIGRFLRRTSLDEVPQFFNVLKGEMSIVGPRPEMKFIVDTYTEYQKARLLVIPGITGLWQIKGRKDLPLHENVEYDLYYIMNRSILLDLKIILQTVSVIFKGKGAY